MNKKMAAMLATMLISLSLVGLAYAHWSEVLLITGTVNTGKLDATLVAGACFDTEPPEKDVSSIFCEVIDGKLVVTVTNAYPCIDYYQEFELVNTGTIPFRIQGPFVYGVKLGPGCESLELEITGQAVTGGAQLHEGDRASGLIHVHLTNDAPELVTIKFVASINVVQWNEYNSGGFGK